MFEIGGIMPSLLAEIQPDEYIITATQDIAEFTTHLIAEIEAAGLQDEAPGLLELLEDTDVLESYWEAWQERMSKAKDIFAANSGFSEPIDSYIELQMLLGGTGDVSNVDIFHTDMTNAEFLPEYVDAGVSSSHGITEQVFTLKYSDRTPGFMIFAEGRDNNEVSRGLFVLADAAPSETVQFTDPENLPGYQLVPGNITDGMYIFGSRNMRPDDIAADGQWNGWQQALPWKFADLSERFHRAPSQTLDRSILLRLVVYVAPARNPDLPLSLRVPVIKSYR